MRASVVGCPRCWHVKKRGRCDVVCRTRCGLLLSTAPQDNDECSLVKMVVSTIDVAAKFTLYNVKTKQLRGQ